MNIPPPGSKLLGIQNKHFFKIEREVKIIWEKEKKHNEEFSYDSLTSTCFVLSATFIFFHL